MMGYRISDSCRKLFFNLKILPLPSQYILSLLLFVIRINNQFLVNSEICHTDTRQHANFHQPSVNLNKYQKGVYYLDGKVFNKLPTYIKIESNIPKKFKLVLEKFLYENSFIIWMNILNFNKVKYIYTWSGMVFESLAHEFNMYVCSFLLYLLSHILNLFVYVTQLHVCTNICLLCSDMVNHFLGL